MTIDVFDSDSDRFLRDNAGFIVADKLRLQQITVRTVEALKELKPSKGGKNNRIREYNSWNRQFVEILMTIYKIKSVIFHSYIVVDFTNGQSTDDQFNYYFTKFKIDKFIIKWLYLKEIITKNFRGKSNKS